MTPLASGDAASNGEPIPVDLTESIIDQLAENGWCMIDDALPRPALDALLLECESLWQDGEFERAGVGRGDDLKIREAIRTDRVLWLDPKATPEATSVYHRYLENLQNSLNRALYLGLDFWEGHFAIYPEGAFYKVHIDQHKGTAARQITTILYLNDGWQDAHGGHLRLYLDESREQYVDIAPEMGRLVVFLAGKFWHEVLPANRERKSITGWFRRGETPIPL